MFLVVNNLPDYNAARSNSLYISNQYNLDTSFVTVNNIIFRVSKCTKMPYGYVGVGSYHRKILNTKKNENIELQPYYITNEIVSHNIFVRFLTNRNVDISFDPNDYIYKTLNGHILYSGATFYINTINDLNVFCEIVNIDTENSFFDKCETIITYLPSTSQNIKLLNVKYKKPPIFKKDIFQYKTLGVGGIDNALDELFKRVFTSRMIDAEYIKKLGMKHVKGVLLYGPPGTGKTALARSIGLMLKSKEPKIVNGPEILNKYVGQSEENIRSLFQDAEIDFDKNGDNADLHVIIFDEIDAICKKRGTGNGGTSGVNDSIVNQLLTKLDGVKALPNILVIGMTNRKDMIDSALLRPGRLEVQIEIGLPNKEGRLQILQIHTHTMSDNAFMDTDVNLNIIADKTSCYSGAELEGIVRYASSMALNRAINTNTDVNDNDIVVKMDDFLNAIENVSCTHASSKIQLSHLIPKKWFPNISYQKRLLKNLKPYTLLESNHRHMSVLINGPGLSGKTTIVAKLCLESNIKNIVYICAKDLLGMNDYDKCNHIQSMMEQAHRTNKSIIIFDEIERLINYVDIGPMFSNTLLQTILVVTRSKPNKDNNKVCIIGTTSLDNLMIEKLNLLQAFKDIFYTDYLISDDYKFLGIRKRFDNQELIPIGKILDY